MKEDSLHPKWVTWAATLRQLREEAGYTQARLGHEAHIARSTVSALERGQLAPDRKQSEAADEVLATGGVLSRLWDDVVRGKHLPEWWQNILALEQRSEEIWEYEPNVIPGLLQTESYAREMMQGGLPRARPERLEELVEQRITRLQTLRDRPEGMPVLRYVLGERALMPAGVDGKMMLEQLDHLVKLMADPSIEIRILTNESIPLHASVPFRINTLSSTRRVAYLEYRDGGVTKDDPELLANLITTFSTLAMEALPADQSLALISEVRARWNGASPATAQTQGTASK